MPVPEDLRLITSKNNASYEYCYVAKFGEDEINFVDYASAGQNYDRQPCRITVWFNMKNQ